jgi:protein ImuB
MFACIHGQGDLTALAFEFSPLLERTAADTVTFDAAGLDRLFGLPQEVAAAIMRRAAERGLAIHLALAVNPDTAICAARGFAGAHVIPQGDEAKFLGSLPLSQLEPSAELQQTLERWGIRRFQDLAALPPLGIAERLGPEGLKMRELARGEAERKLVPLQEPERFEDQIEPDYPVELLEPLLFLVARLLNGLSTRLATRALATNELRIGLLLETRGTHERTLRLPVPSLDCKAFLKLIQLDLTEHPPPAPVVLVKLEAAAVKPQAAQNGLFVPLAPEPVKLEVTLARIAAMVGRDRVGVVELVDTHRPGAFKKQATMLWNDRRKRLSHCAGERVDEPNCPSTPPGADDRLLSSARPAPNRLVPLGAGGKVGQALSPARPIPAFAFRFFRPPRAARVELKSARPDFVAAQGIRGTVLDLAGPWRTSGDWWTQDPWSRDEWDIALSDGALYRLYCCPEGWFVEGTYD